MLGMAGCQDECAVDAKLDRSPPNSHSFSPIASSSLSPSPCLPALPFTQSSNHAIAQSPISPLPAQSPSALLISAASDSFVNGLGNTRVFLSITPSAASWSAV